MRALENRIVCLTYSVKAQLSWEHNHRDKCESYAQSMEYKSLLHKAM